MRLMLKNDFLEKLLFDFVMESIVCKDGVQRTGRIKNKSVQLLAYADDIENIEYDMRDVTRLLKRNQLKAKMTSARRFSGESQCHSTGVTMV